MTYLKEAQQFLVQLGEQQFFGRVTFEFKRGEVVMVRTEQTMLPSEAASKMNYGRTNERSQSR